MSDACTIYCEKADYNAVYQTIANLSPVPLEIKGTEDNWQSITVVQKSTIRFNSMEGQAGKFDKFSELILGTYSYFRNIQTEAEARKERILRSVSECRFAIGVGGFPEYSESEGHYDMIWAVAKTLHGIIFNGSAMIDENGLMILNSDGNFEDE